MNLTDTQLSASLLDYFSIEPYLVSHETDKAGGIVSKRVPNDLPTPVGWCARNGWSERRLSERLSGSAALTEVAEVCAAKMKHHLIVNGLNKGSYESAFAVLAVKNLAGWSEKSEVKESREYVVSEADRRMLERAGLLTAAAQPLVVLDA